MKTVVVIVLLVLSVIVGYEGYAYLKFDNCLKESEQKFYSKDYSHALSTIDELRLNRWYKPINNYPRIDIFEINTQLDYQKGRIFSELGNLKEAYALFEKCSNGSSLDLASKCLYQQGDIALYQGNLNAAEKKWQAALEKGIGGHDFDAQVNLELLKNEQKKGLSAATAAIMTHRRSKNPHFHLRQPNQKEGAVKP